MRKLKLELTYYKGFAMGFVWVNSQFEIGVCFVFPFFSIDFMRKKN